MRRLHNLTLLFTLFACVSATSAIEINEIRIDQPSSDLDEYFELTGNPGESLDGLAYLVLGDGVGGSGTIESLIPLDGLTIPDDGFFLAAEDTFTMNDQVADLVTVLNFENGDNVTHILVSEFSPDFTLGDDLDFDPEDGILDENPWGSLVDAIGFIQDADAPDNGEYFYGDALGFNDFGPDGEFVPAHMYRVDNEGSSWTIGKFVPSESVDTPGESNNGNPVVVGSDCDFNSDKLCDQADADLLTASGNLVDGFAADASTSLFDLNNDQQIDFQDLSEWLVDTGKQNGFAGPLQPGDINLDGSIDAADLNVVGIGWLKPGDWSQGDVNGDGVVDAGDLNLVGIGWQSVVPANAATAAVPEPSGVFWTLLPWLVFCASRFRTA